MRKIVSHLATVSAGWSSLLEKGQLIPTCCSECVPKYIRILLVFCVQFRHGLLIKRIRDLSDRINLFVANFHRMNILFSHFSPAVKKSPVMWTI